MLPIPELTDVDEAFGNIDHMPAYDTLPVEFKRHNGNAYCKAVSYWFFAGAKREGDRLIVDGVVFAPKEGVDSTKALSAIRVVLGSFAPKHEHKEAACAFMLSEWFDVVALIEEVWR